MCSYLVGLEHQIFSKSSSIFFLCIRKQHLQLERSRSVCRALDWGSKGCWFKSQCRWSHCVVSFSKTLCPLLSAGSIQEDLSPDDWDVKNQTKQNLQFRKCLLSQKLFRSPPILKPYVSCDMRFPTMSYV